MPLISTVDGTNQWDEDWGSVKEFYATPDRGQPEAPIFDPPLQAQPYVDDTLKVENPARIAIYDDLLSAPRVVVVEPQGIREYLDEISLQTYNASRLQGGEFPYTVIEQVVENFIHAYFEEPTISITNDGRTIRFTDQGPGISNKELAQQVGVTSASQDMKRFIRGVGSGLPTVKEYLTFQGGRMTIEDNINKGTIITITMVKERDPIQEEQEKETFIAINIDDDQRRALYLFDDFDLIGPKELRECLGMADSTASRKLQQMADFDLIKKSGIKYKLTEFGKRYIESL